MRANLLGIFGLILSLCLSSCRQDNLSNFVSAKEQEQSNKVVPLEYGEVLTQKKSEYVMIPVGYKLKSDKRIIDYSLSASNPSKTKFSGWNGLSAINLIFHGQENDQTHLLLDRNAFIAQFDYLVDGAAITGGANRYSGTSFCNPPKGVSADHSFNHLIIYKIVEQDTNQNQVLDLKDADRGYLSDLSGKNLRSLTPDHTKLTQWHCDYGRNQLLLFVQELDRESHKNQINPTALYIYDLAGNEPLRVTPPQSNLEHWKIKLADGLIYLHSRIDSNGDRQYTATDDTIVTKYNLDSKEALEINHPQIRQLLQQPQK